MWLRPPFPGGVLRFMIRTSRLYLSRSCRKRWSHGVSYSLICYGPASPSQTSHSYGSNQARRGLGSIGVACNQMSFLRRPVGKSSPFLFIKVSWLTIYLYYIDVVMIFCSGDCGMYAIKHIEHLLCGLKLDTIIDDNMSLFGKEWYVDLWYQDVGPWVFLGCTCILIKNSVYIFWY